MTKFTVEQMAGMSKEELMIALAQSQTTSGPLSFKVSEKGAVSVIGLQRFPVTLYAGQWERLIGAVPDLKAFIVAHAAQLSRKAEAPATVAPVASAEVSRLIKKAS